MSDRAAFHARTAIVTGGASGIGRALVAELGRRGAVVIVADVDAAGAEKAANAVRADGGTAEAQPLDVTRAEDVEALVAGVVARHGRLDYLFNNAGIAVGGEVRDLGLEHWRRIIDVNLLGPIHGVAAAYPRMVQQGAGHIVNVASLAGLGAAPMMAPYATTKFGLVGLSLSLRAEAEALGVRVSVVCPGFVQSGIYDAATVVNADRTALFEKMPFPRVPAERAARRILDGVARNEAIIVFPFYARVLWWLGRLSPAVLRPLHRRMVADFRAARARPRARAPADPVSVVRNQGKN
ncbi:MAG: SDR family NAD(P)-dependent oxidoreductase [Candidatus Rokubacteria bacterium]|nr:SDR family NAD(P)-dependent oxidoreductase [Candidatus Rokubacteria bacterium]